MARPRSNPTTCQQCSEPAKCKGLRNKHYQRVKVKQRTTIGGLTLRQFTKLQKAMSNLEVTDRFGCLATMVEGYEPKEVSA